MTTPACIRRTTRWLVVAHFSMPVLALGAVVLWKTIAPAAGVAVFVGVVAAYLAARRWMRRRIATMCQRGIATGGQLCLQCAFDLSGMPAPIGQCPECGVWHNTSHALTEWTDALREHERAFGAAPRPAISPQTGDSTRPR